MNDISIGVEGHLSCKALTGLASDQTSTARAVHRYVGKALERFSRTNPSEVAESVARSKKKKPPGDEPPGGARVETKGGVPPDRRRKRGDT